MNPMNAISIENRNIKSRESAGVIEWIFISAAKYEIAK